MRTGKGRRMEVWKREGGELRKGKGVTEIKGEGGEEGEGS